MKQLKTCECGECQLWLWKVKMNSLKYVINYGFIGWLI